MTSSISTLSVCREISRRKTLAMTSERAVRANRANAIVSTGPRTPRGKARAGQNALKHGLTVQRSSPETDGKIRRLAAAFAGENADDAIVQDAARSLAEAQLHLQRVQRVKIMTLNMLLKLALTGHDEQLSADRLQGPQAFDQLIKLERYERRALSRRKSAMKAMEEVLKSPCKSSSLRS